MDTYKLSKREKQVAELLLQGKSNKQIAAALHISEGTVEFHLTRIYGKLGVGSRAEAIIRLSQPGKSLVNSESQETRGDEPVSDAKSGESPVANPVESANNGSDLSFSTQENLNMIYKISQLDRKYQILITLIIIFGVIVIVGFVLSAPKTWKQYEREGDVQDVVFPAGWILEGDRLMIFYGGADSCIALATASVAEVTDYIMQCPETDY